MPPRTSASAGEDAPPAHPMSPAAAGPSRIAAATVLLIPGCPSLPRHPVVVATSEHEPHGRARLVGRVAQAVRRHRVEVDGVTRTEVVGLEPDLHPEPAPDEVAVLA